MSEEAENLEKIDQYTKFIEENTEKDQESAVGVSSANVLTLGVSSAMSIDSVDPAILKLDIDCFGETFDYLALKDLISVGKTCKRLQNESGYILHQNYPNIIKECTINRCNAWIKSFGALKKFEINIFSRFIDRICIRNSNGLRHFLRKNQDFEILKQISFDSISLTIDDAKDMKTTLSKVESLRFVDCEIYGNLYDTVLAFCGNLKHLYIDRVQIKNDDGSEVMDLKEADFRSDRKDESLRNGNDQNNQDRKFNLSTKKNPKHPKMRIKHDWLRKKYPNLEHLELISYTELLIELVIFFKLNPNIRKLTVNDEFLWENSEVMLHVNIKLDELIISRCSEGTMFRYCEEDEPVEEPLPQNDPPQNEKLNVNLPKEQNKSKENENGESSSGPKRDEPPKDESGSEKSNEYTFYELLDKLYARQFYRRLQWVCYPTFFQELADEMVSINGLTTLVLNSETDPVALSKLRSLEELHVGNTEQITDFEILPNNLINLTRINFEVVFFDQIVVMVSQARKLRKIKINSLLDRSRRRQNGTYEHIKYIDLGKLNAERELLNAATKVFIYVDEDVYLNTKWSLGGTDFNLIRLKRKESFACGFDCNSLYKGFENVVG